MKIDSEKIAFPGKQSITPRNGFDETDLIQIEISPDDKLSDQSAPNISSLRLHMQAIQEVQKNLGIQSQAATFFDPITQFFGGLSLGGKIALVLTGWAAAVFTPDLVKFVDEKISKPLGKHWNDDLFSPDEGTRNKAIKTLTEAEVDNPREVVQCAEFTFREYVLGSLKASNKDLSSVQDNIRQITAALEGLYKLESSTKDKNVYLDKTMTHGWQNHNSFLRVIATGSGVVSAGVNPINWFRGTTKKEIEKHTSASSLKEAKGWYSHDNACKLIATLLEECIDGSFKLDEASKDSLMRILILNPKVPIKASGSDSGIQGTLIPQTARSNTYRLDIYQTILNTLKGEKELTSEDPLFLKTYLVSIPEGQRNRAKDFREALLTALTAEIGLEKTNSTQYSKDVVKKIEEILHVSGDCIPSEMPKWKWEAGAKAQREIELKNQERLAKFKRWGHTIPAYPKYTESNLEKIFSQFSQAQKENIERLNDFYAIQSFKTTDELNNWLHLDDKSNPGILNIMDLDNQKEGEKLNQRTNEEKGLYFFRYLNAILDKQLLVGEDQKTLKDYLDSRIKEYLLDVSKMIVNDQNDFGATTRDYKFYINPAPNTIPGQALILHHKLAPCFTNGGYVDIYNIKDRMISVAVHNFSPELLSVGEKAQNGFLLSGPIGTGKSYAAKALANQLAVPLYTLQRNSIVRRGEDFMVKIPDVGEIPLGHFISEIKKKPCVLLYDEVNKILVPKNSDPERRRDATKEEEDLTTAFLTDLQDFRNDQDKDASNVIVIYTTNYPEPTNVDLNKIDKDGQSLQALEELKKDVSSAALRGKRLDFKIFSFHKLYDALQGEALVKHFLEPYILLGKLDRPDNYLSIAEKAKDYTPGDIENAFIEASREKTGKLTLDDFKAALDKQSTRKSSLVVSEREETLKSAVLYLSKFKKKKVSGNFDFKEMTIASAGLSDEQIRKALEEFTPETLTQENIIAAFEQVRKSAS